MSMKNFNDWHFPLVVIAVSVLIVGATALMVLGSTSDIQSRIDLCVEAFEYTRAQCEFIVRNRSAVSP